MNCSMHAYIWWGISRTVIVMCSPCSMLFVARPVLACVPSLSSLRISVQVRALVLRPMYMRPVPGVRIPKGAAKSYDRVKRESGAREARPARSAGFLRAPQAIFLAHERPILMILLHFLAQKAKRSLGCLNTYFTQVHAYSIQRGSCIL